MLRKKTREIFVKKIDQKAQNFNHNFLLLLIFSSSIFLCFVCLFGRCFIIEAVEESRNKVFGVLKANPAFKYNIDYEKYEIIYLSIIVTDLNQEVNLDSAVAILTVRIIDENDNPPEFVGDTLIVPRNVIEEAQAGTLIGTIIAIDIDGPEYNIIQYFMRYSMSKS